jgi:hypothetical protein
MLGVFALFFILTATMRLVMISGTYGQVLLEIPVISHPTEDPSFHNFQELPQEVLKSTTPAVVITSESFFFGDLDSFSTSFSDVQKKFKIPHKNGAPQVSQLISTMDQWLRTRSKAENLPLSKTLVVVPSGEIPLPIVIQVVATLNKSPIFQHIILSNGLI